MKISLSLVLLLVVSTAALESLSEDQLSQELSANRKLWIVHRSGSESDVAGRVSSILKGFFQVAWVSGSEESLVLYGDDREDPLTYDGELVAEKVVTWALEQLDLVIAGRSEEAASLKAFQ
jgi:hypothetical protein